MKLAYHALTGDKVAIKIMDKRTLGVSFTICSTGYRYEFNTFIHHYQNFLSYSIILLSGTVPGFRDVKKSRRQQCDGY